MFWVNMLLDGRRDTPVPYENRDDAMRKVNALSRDLAKSAFRGSIEFEIVCDDGQRWGQDSLLQEIASRADLREPEKIR